MSRPDTEDMICIIPARGGSKRIPGKNIKLLGGRPLIAWTVELAIASNAFSRVIVSTDDEGIAKTARELGAEVPWLRSKENSEDSSSSVDAVLEVLDKIEGDGDTLPDSLMLLQPTSPFRKLQTITSAIRKFREAGGESVVSVSLAEKHPDWFRTVNGGVLEPLFKGEEVAALAHDTGDIYVLNGLIYMTSTTNLQEKKSFYSVNTRALITDDPVEAIDIDTPSDWLIAEAICEFQQREHK